jgi:hypothetical protein
MLHGEFQTTNKHDGHSLELDYEALKRLLGIGRRGKIKAKPLWKSEVGRTVAGQIVVADVVSCQISSTEISA